MQESKMRNCCQCSMCCKLLDVSGLAASGVWCPNAIASDKGGCVIYDARPSICMGFDCLWLQSDILGDNLRPDRCGIVFELYSEESFVIAMVDEYRADAWRKGEPSKLIMQMLKDGYFVWVRVKKTRHLLLCGGVTEEEAIERSRVAWGRKMGRTKWQSRVIPKT